ncbi:MAG: Obg family GTPase CgtA, partial [Clostridia bacterium]|nr:Obg family GTPase CgtA [Clostridia bacterium]
ISVVSEAKPKIANYHFTTLTPVLGVVRVDEGTSFVMADIPGLIEGAGEGIGLGHEFLRHVERCRMLVHVLDISGSEGRDPKEDFDKINKELAVFSEELKSRPQIVVGNKCDLCDEEQIEEIKNYFEEKGYKFFPVMAAIAEGTAEVVNCIAEELSRLPAIKKYEAEPRMVEDFTFEKKRSFNIRACDGVFFVEDAPWLLQVMDTIDPEDYESLQYFERVLRSSGIIDALLEAGVTEGDTVSVYDIEFEYME